jgi:hypothetical protein
MARISNTSVYPNINPVLSDYFVLTDANDDLSTKTCTLESLQQLYNVDVVSKSITVSPLYLNVLATQDFEILPAPGSAYVYDIQRIVVFMDPGSTVYDFATDLPSFDMGSLALSDIQISTMNSSTDVVEVIYTGGTTNFVLPTNTSVVLSKAGSNPTQGNGTLYVNISYRKLKLNSTF